MGGGAPFCAHAKNGSTLQHALARRVAARTFECRLIGRKGAISLRMAVCGKYDSPRGARRDWASFEKIAPRVTLTTGDIPSPAAVGDRRRRTLRGPRYQKCHQCRWATAAAWVALPVKLAA